MKVVVVSGGFDPLHFGHVRMFEAARKLGSKLVVILNNDNWLLKKKGYVFYPKEQRKEILEALVSVDEVILSKHESNPTSDMSVCNELKEIMPDIFANGGDRVEGNVPEVELCKKLLIELVWNVGGEKVQSSSEVAKKIIGS